MAFAALLCIGFAACSSDDDGGASAVPAPTLTDTNGNAVQVLSAGGVWFRYDDDGKLSSFGDSYETYSIEGNSFTITYDDAYTANFTINGSGLISKISMSCDLKGLNGSGSYDKENITLSCKYNSARQLIGASYSGSGDWYDGKERGSASGTGSLTNTWVNGNLVTSVQESRISGKKGGQSYSRHETGTYTFSYGNELNPIKQFPYFMGEGATGIDGEGFGLFCIVGLYGVGPAYLPTGYVEEWTEEGDSYEPESRNYTLSFTMNDNGTINTEQQGYTRIVYQYKIDTRSIAEQAESLLPALKRQMTKLLKPNHR